MFVPIRMDAGREWCDVGSASMSREGAEQNVDVEACKIPGWHKANPLVRIGTFELHEVES